MPTKISCANIRAFRGIPGELSIDFRDLTGQPVSLVLVGDNGTGKSSVADALEFCLQARIGRHKSLTNPGVSSPISFASADLPIVRTTLSTGDVVERTIRRTDGVPLIAPTRAHRDFSFAAFVLRRADILRFLETSEDDRQLMFLDYLGGRGEWAGSMEERDQLLRSRKDVLRKSIEDQLSELAKTLGWEYPENLLDEPGFESLLRKRLYRGMSPQQAASRGYRVTVRPAVQKRIEAIKQTMREFKAASRAARQIGKIGVDFKKAMETLRAVLTNASDILTAAFHDISNVAFVDRLELTAQPGKQFSLKLQVHLKNGGICAANQVFSEANQDLLALLVFLSVIEQATHNGQAPCLVLDDVLQSVDAGVRVAVTEHMVRRLSGWQLVFTAHDRLWQAQLRSILQRAGHQFIEREIVRWSFDDGPVLVAGRNEDEERLRIALGGSDPIGICSQAGLLLESFADRMSWTLPVAVTRRFGDRYTLGDLWPAVIKALRQTKISALADAADRWAHLRNIAGAHHNEWAKSLSLDEARQFGTAVLSLHDAVRCSSCHRFVERAGTSRRWECRCGSLIIG